MELVSESASSQDKAVCTDLDGISPGARKLEGRVADNRVANDDAKLATACNVVGLACSAGWIEIEC